ncbi:HECT-domain-containing protein [Anaeromyces robustus]|uniref:HECT-type E3 ubiquitin transferase n=1 Tax=Anaeromyces robustus TaxID=1754192 RepID=A0A1Y1XLH5_9FUNG|nr:HECT-domain-containing protein [Anaeromyces robustus]|eukprot:ORX86582.1 HECT-domain-containing protein [Anaeromyces robustus]
MTFNYDSIMLKMFKIIKENNNNNNNNNKTTPRRKGHHLFNDLELELSSALVIATNKFIANKYDQLDLDTGELLIVTDWNYEDGWAFGHRKNNKEEKGKFPKVLVRICNKGDEELEGSSKNIITTEYKIKFEEKIENLRNSLEIENIETEILIHRKNLFNDAYDSIMNRSPNQLKNRLRIKYIGEEGIDTGGLLRDFFHNISKEIGNPNYSLFQYSSNNNSYELDVNPLSCVIDSNHLKYYRFIGRIMGLAIFHRQYLSINFSLIFYKKLLDKQLTFSDLEYVDPEMYKNIKWLKNNNGAENLCLTFALDTKDCFGNQKSIELKPNGANIEVTDSNKKEYINLIVKYKLNNTNDKKQFKALKKGFYEIVPSNKIHTLFNEVDLKYLLVGINEIDIDDWEKNTDYEGYKTNDITIINFWKCVRDFDNENRIKLLIFATGNSQVPVTGFKDLQGNGRITHFKLKNTGNLNDLPKSHTCFNRIDLPPYTSYTILKQKLLLAISEGVGSFSLE